MSDIDLGKAVTENLKIDSLTSLPDSGMEKKSLVQAKARGRRVSDKLVLHHKPRSIESEYFRFLKSKIEHLLDDTKDANLGRVLLVTGASLGSGKTTCALNLSLAFAKAYGNRTLFLDADTRSPKCLEYMGFSDTNLPGFSDVLSLKARAGSVLINTGLSDLICLPSGRFTEEYVDRLRGDELTTLLNGLRSRFRYVVIDCPPAFPMPEPAILGRHCDGVLMVLGAGKDGKEHLHQSLEAMQGCNIIGAILNGVKAVPGQHYSYSGYYSR